MTPALLIFALALPVLAQAVPDPQGEPAAPKAPAPPPQPKPILPPTLQGDPVLADYPPAQVAQGRGARVVIELTVDEAGQPQGARVLTPPQPGFDESALAAAQKLRFTPARSGEKPIAVRIQTAFNFAPPPLPEPLEAASLKPVTLAGTVRERGTRRRLPGLEVAVPAAGITALTDAKGHFELPGVPPGKANIVIAAAGYQRFTAEERITENERTEVDYRLEPVFSSPFELTVEGERERREVSRTEISSAEIEKIPGAQGDALKIVEDLPGVARTSPIGGGALVIRGSKPGDSLVYLDGEPIPLLYHFGALSSTVNPDLLEGIEFIPGNFSATYGDLTGGLVEVRTRKLREEPHGYANINLLETSALLEGAIPGVPGLSLALAGRRSYIDLVLRAVLPANGDFGFTTAPTYYDGQFRLDYRPPGSAHQLSLLALTSDDALGVLLKRPTEQDPNLSGDIDTETGFQQLRLKHSYRKGHFSLQTVAMVEKILLRFQVAANSFQLLGHNQFFRSTGSWEIADDLGFSVGVDLANRRNQVSAQLLRSFLYREGDFNSQGPRPDASTLFLPTTYFDRFSPGLWIEARYQPLPHLTLTPGLRFDAFHYAPAEPQTTVTLTPRLSARWELNPKLTLKGGFGFYSEGARNGDAARPFGNPQVLPERAWQATLGTELRPLPGVLLTAEGFYKRLTDLIVRTDATQALNGQTVPQLLDNAGTGKVYGIELLLRKELTERFFGWLAYTLSRSDRVDRPGDAQRLFDFDQTHNLTAIASYKLGAGWQLGVRLRLISGNPDTPVLGSRYLAQYDTYLPVYGATNSRRDPLFHSLDVRLDKTWTFNNFLLDAYLDVLNAYNHRSIEGTAYSYDYSQRSFFKGLPVLPTLGVKGSF